MRAGQKEFAKVIDGIIELAEMAAKEPWDVPEEDKAVTALGKDNGESTSLRMLLRHMEFKEKSERSAAISAVNQMTKL